MNIKARWINRENEPIPGWLQGRGWGVSGGDLILWFGDETKKVFPNEIIELVEENGKEYIRIK